MNNQLLTSGVDIVKIDRFETLDPAIRVRFINRVYTPAENKLCANRNESLAGRFAAKEAVAKALGCGIGTIRWQDIEILAEDSGKPLVNLTGKAKFEADAAAIYQINISLSHSKDYAVAFVIGETA